MTKKLTAVEQKKFKEMVDLFGGDKVVNKAKVKTRILNLRKRKSNRTTKLDMEEMLGY